MSNQQVTLSEQEVVELLAYLITSGRGLVHEPQDYGPMRFVEATRRLTSLVLPQAGDRLKPFLGKLAHDIQIWETERRRDPQGYVAFMDECCRTVARALQQLEPESEPADG